MCYYILTCTFSVFLTDNKLIYKHTDSVQNRHNGGTHDHMTAGSVGPDTMTSASPSVYVQTWQWFVWKGRDRAGVFVHGWLFTQQWSSSWTRFRDEAHLQYKNIVQQFSCHSKHSYLSFNDPITSAATQKKKKKPTFCYTKFEIRRLKPENISNICSELAHGQPIRGGRIKDQQ